MNGYREGDAYLVMKPGRYHSELKINKATQRKPTATPEGSIVVKVRIRVPHAAFLPLKPEAVITVPEELVQHPVEIEAVEPE